MLTIFYDSDNNVKFTKTFKIMERDSHNNITKSEMFDSQDNNKVTMIREFNYYE